MGNYGITGWSGGGRRPLTYNLRPGQFRGMGYTSIFPGPRTVINNYGGGYNYGYNNYNNNTSMPSWMNWMMGGGMIMNMFGNLMQTIFPHKNSDGRGSSSNTQITQDQMADLYNYKTNVPEVKCSGPNSDGTFLVSYKDESGNKVNTKMTYDELILLYQSKWESGGDAGNTSKKAQKKDPSTIEDAAESAAVKKTGDTKGSPDAKGDSGSGDSPVTSVKDSSEETSTKEEEVVVLENKTQATNATTITIKQGQGILYAINDKLEGSHKKISNANAKQVMDLIKDWNSDPQNKEKITSDGNNKFYTGHSNLGKKNGVYGFTVQPNQEITIPAALWTKIEDLATTITE